MSNLYIVLLVVGIYFVSTITCMIYYWICHPEQNNTSVNPDLVFHCFIPVLNTILSFLIIMGGTSYYIASFFKNSNQ